MMIFTLLLPCVLFGTLKVDAEAVYYYDSSNYKIINDVAKCADLGDDWDLATFDKSRDFDLIPVGMLVPSCGIYQIRGSTNNTYWFTALSDYYPDNSGVLKVKAKLGCEVGATLVLAHLDRASDNRILCQKQYKNLLEFSSSESYYKILFNNSAKNNITYWSFKCEGLGDGWAPAVFESEDELIFVQESQQRNRNVGSYWIGGSTDAEIDSTIRYSDYYTNGSSGTYNVIINPGKSRNIAQLNFRLKSKASSRPTPGILCEKAAV